MSERRETYAAHELGVAGVAMVEQALRQALAERDVARTWARRWKALAYEYRGAGRSSASARSGGARRSHHTTPG
jgi:hypothetical protein